MGYASLDIVAVFSLPGTAEVYMAAAEDAPELRRAAGKLRTPPFSSPVAPACRRPISGKEFLSRSGENFGSANHQSLDLFPSCYTKMTTVLGRGNGLAREPK